LCTPLCDPVLQDCQAPLACYLDPVAGESSCVGVAGAGLQGQACTGDENGACFLNGCAPGHGALLPLELGAPVEACAFYCAPVETHTGNTTFAAGDPDFV